MHIKLFSKSNQMDRKYELSGQIQHSLETDCIISQSQGKLNISNVGIMRI